MPHPEIFFAPALMLADYYLTLAGAAAFGRTPAERAAYELNPAFKNDIASRRLASPRALMGVAVVTAGLFALQYVLGGVLVVWVLGLFVGSRIVLVGVHLANLVELGRIARARKSGLAVTTYRYRLMSSTWRTLCTAFLPLAVVAAFVPSPFALSAAAGALVVAAAPLIWRAHQPGEILDKASPSPAAPAAPPQKTCAFCERPASAVPFLIAGKNGAICSECVATCVETLAERTAAGAPG